MASKEIRVPDLGDFKDVAVIEVLVQPGETVEVDTPLLTLETEKATMDVPSTEAGVIEQLHVKTGARVSAGSLVATLRTSESADPAPAAARTDGGGDAASAGAAVRTPNAPPSPARASTPSSASATPAPARTEEQIPPTEATPPMPPRPGEPVDQAALPAELGVLGSGSHASWASIWGECVAAVRRDASRPMMSRRS